MCNSEWIVRRIDLLCPAVMRVEFDGLAVPLPRSCRLKLVHKVIVVIQESLLWSASSVLPCCCVGFFRFVMHFIFTRWWTCMVAGFGVLSVCLFTEPD